MIFIFGQRRARIGRFIDQEELCYRCRAYDHEVNVYQSYFHLTFIPCFPTGPRTFEMRCRSCGDDTKRDAVIDHFRGKVRTPLYLFSGPALVILIGIAWFFWHAETKKATESFLGKPVTGDVYTLEKETRDGPRYTFLRVAGVARDSILMLSNDLEYPGFVSDLADDDYFRSDDTLVFTRRKLRAMREDGVITRIQRNLGKDAGFNRTR